MNVIYGVPITDAISEKLNQMSDGGEELFETFYHGGASRQVGFCGVFLDRADECADTVVSKLKLEPTKEQKEKAEKMINDLPKDIKQILPEIGVWIVWSTS